MVSVNKYTDEENGTGARNRPNSSAITHSSRCPRPKPLYFSGILIPVQPSETIFAHKSLSTHDSFSRTVLFRNNAFSLERNFFASSFSIF